MIFTDFKFIPFFLAVLVVHWGLRRDRSRKLWLLAASYVFYGFWDWRFAGLILASSLVDYTAGAFLSRTDDPRSRRAWMATSLVINLGALGFFKYFNFFVVSAHDALAWIGLPTSPATLSIILPVGISFYTFQTLSYTLDIYRRELEPCRSLLDFLLFVSFFPQLVAGPIVRAREFLPQLAEPRRFRDVHVRTAIVLILIGYFKKACVSDNVSPVVDAYYGDPASFDSLSTWIANLMFMLQMYCDFSGYSDLAIGCAALLGYRLPLNFDFPLMAPNIAEFWRRWHVTLSQWLRDYVYRPLQGGSRDLARADRNMVITMLVAGLWHGAAWTFVLWGGIQGLALVVHRWYRKRLPKRARMFLKTPVGFVLALAFQTCFSMVHMIWFRAPSVGAAVEVSRGFFGLSEGGVQAIAPGWIAVWGVLALVHAANYRYRWAERWATIPPLAFAATAGIAAAFIFALRPAGTQPFIYFQF